MDYGLTVKITHPHGVNMRFSESITRFLIERSDKSSPFCVGNWIGLLDNDSIAQLCELTRLFFTGTDAPIFDDLVQVALLAVSAESQKDKVDISPEIVNAWMGVIAFGSALESCKRRGLIECSTTLTMNPNHRALITITALGLKCGLDLHSMMH